MAGYGISLEGTAELIKRLQGEHLLAKPVRRIFSKIGIKGKAAAKMGARMGGSGRMSGSVTSHLSSRSIPTFVAIVVKAENKGYHYPRLLEFSPKHHHKDWLMTAVSSGVGNMSALARELATDIEKQFRSAA